jgi:hypothetical protein
MPPRKKAKITLAGSYMQAELVATDVADPYEKGAEIRVMKNVREHPLHRLHHLGVIRPHQYLAGMEFCRRFELAGIGKQGAIDYSQDRVDGGLPAEPLSERMVEAFQWLNDVARYPDIGKQGFVALEAVCGQGKAVSEWAREIGRTNGYSKQRAEGYAAITLNNALIGLDKFIEWRNGKRR